MQFGEYISVEQVTATCSKFVIAVHKNEGLMKAVLKPSVL